MHVSVLLHDALSLLSPKKGGVYVDATFGAGGHSRHLASEIGKEGTLIAFDADRSVFDAPVVGQIQKFTQFLPIVANFRTVGKVLTKRKQKIDGILFDLGLSSTQLESSGRGFTFKKNEPLEMTFSKKAKKNEVTAFAVVNTWSEETLVTIFKGFGEERFARSIAKHIVLARKVTPIATTTELVEVIHQSTPGWYQRGKTHFATKTFQAIRMAVNDELGAIEEGIRGAVLHLHAGGKIVVITFHSIEDRLVKQLFREFATAGKLTVMTKKPITPSVEELQSNPRSRSAKLRVAVKNS